MKVHVTEHGVHLLRGPEIVETLSEGEALKLVLDLLGATSLSAALRSASHAEAYGRIEWLSVRDVVALLRVPRRSAQRLMGAWKTTHTRVPGGDRYVARFEVEGWASRALKVAVKRAS